MSEVITSVVDEGNGFMVHVGCMVFFMDKKLIGDVIPKEGDSVVLHCIHGTQVRGIDLNGVNLYYTSDEELERQHQEWLIQNQKEKEERFKKQQNKLNKDYDSLPPCFKKRIDRFRLQDENFRIDSEAYEMFCLTQAVVIAKSVDDIKSFYALSWEEQIKQCPELSHDHSGNTFQGACKLAFAYKNNPNADC